MSKKLEPRKHLFQHSEHVILGFNSTAELAQKMGRQKQTDQFEMFLFTKIQFSIVLIFCNYLDTWYMWWLIFYTRYVLFFVLPYSFFLRTLYGGLYFQQDWLMK